MQAKRHDKMIGCKLRDMINECGNNKRVQWELISNVIYHMIKLDRTNLLYLIEDSDCRNIDCA